MTSGVFKTSALAPPQFEVGNTVQNVHNSKIDDGAQDSSKIDDGAQDSSKIDNGAQDSSKIDNGARSWKKAPTTKNTFLQNLPNTNSE